jgi:hypothetical protein
MIQGRPEVSVEKSEVAIDCSTGGTFPRETQPGLGSPWHTASCHSGLHRRFGTAGMLDSQRIVYRAESLR